jgi:splicing factor U2AF subunit
MASYAPPPAAAAVAPAAGAAVGSVSAPIGVPSTVVLLDHMVSPGELVDDGEYADIVGDVTHEAGRYGALLSVLIPRGGPGLGRVFLQYGDVMGAISAATSLAGRSFGGKPIVARYYDEGAFAAGALDR